MIPPGLWLSEPVLRRIWGKCFMSQLEPSRFSRKVTRSCCLHRSGTLCLDAVSQLWGGAQRKCFPVTELHRGAGVYSLCEQSKASFSVFLLVQHNTMESLLERGEKLDDLVSKSEVLGIQSKAFYKTVSTARLLPSTPSREQWPRAPR